MALSRGALFVALLAGACRREVAVETRPDWRGHTVDGMAPLMTPDRIERALAAHGYRPRACGDRAPAPDALRRSTDQICYVAAARHLHAILNFKQLPEGRRLSTLSFYEVDRGRHDEAAVRARYRPFLRHLIVRWGPPTLQQGGGPVTTRLWTVPGGSPSLPDNVTSGESGAEGPNLTMTSFWTYENELGPGGRAAAAR